MTLLCNGNLNSFHTRVRKLFKGGNYSREEAICGNTVPLIGLVLCPAVTIFCCEQERRRPDLNCLVCVPLFLPHL